MCSKIKIRKSVDEIKSTELFIEDIIICGKIRAERYRA